MAEVRLALTEPADPRHLGSAAAPSTPALPVWHRTGHVRLGQTGPIQNGPTAARFDGGAALSTVIAGPSRFWTMAATVKLDQNLSSGTILAVDEKGLDGPVRALIVRQRRLAVIAWSWAGGVACWSTECPVPLGRWAHLAAVHGRNGDLYLTVDGALARVFAVRELWPGRRDLQSVTVGAATALVSEVVPGWRGLLQGVQMYDHALDLAQVEQLARKALGVAEPAPEPEPAPVAAPVRRGCENWAHQPGWREDGHGGLACRLCDPPRGCKHDHHALYWRPVSGSDVWSAAGLRALELECTQCAMTTSKPLAATGA